MFDPQVTFQRTHTGRTEIHEKKAGLTQSERLVLIMVDGVTPYQGVRTKLPVLTHHRFERAIRTLLQKELISEVFMPVDGAHAEQVEKTVIDRFLQQDPLDPLTIIVAPEVEGLDLRPDLAAIPASMAGENAPPDAPATVPVAALDEQDEFHADEIGREARARQQERPPRTPVRIRTTSKSESRASKHVPGQGAPIVYWVMAISGAFILGYALARLSA